LRLIAFDREGERRLGALAGDGEWVLDLADARPDLPLDLAGFLADGEPARLAVRKAMEEGSPECLRPLDEVTLRAPLDPPPRNPLCVGKNYAAHAGELAGSAGATSGVGEEVPKHPIFFTKANTAVIGPEEVVPATRDETGTVDYEGEVAVVIGRGGRAIGIGRGWEHVFGLTLVNDVTSRALQRRHGQWFLGKSLDGFAPLGPAVVTLDELPDPGGIRVTTHVNGELRQCGTLQELIFPVPALIESLSRRMTLVPGDIVATGTPPGVGVAFDPPRFLQPGDRVTVRAEGIGTLSNPVG